MAEYIDRDAFIAHIRKDPLFGMVEQYGITGVIKAFPAADVQPVKHGRWSGDFCSNCGISKYNFISFNIVGEKEYARPFGTWKYCPRCGAKMDGKE